MAPPVLHKKLRTRPLSVTISFFECEVAPTNIKIVNRVSRTKIGDWGRRGVGEFSAHPLSHPCPCLLRCVRTASLRNNCARRTIPAVDNDGVPRAACAPRYLVCRLRSKRSLVLVGRPSGRRDDSRGTASERGGEVRALTTSANGTSAILNVCWGGPELATSARGRYNVGLL